MNDGSVDGAGPTLEPVDILIVDDEPDIASALREFLDDAGYRVQVSGSVAAARHALVARPSRWCWSTSPCPTEADST